MQAVNMKFKQVISLLLSFVMVLGMLSGCHSEPTPTETTKPTNPEQPAPLVQMSEIFREAVERGIAWEELAVDADSHIRGADLVKLMNNALTVQGKPDSVKYLNSFSDFHGNDSEIQHYQLAQLLYGIYNDVIDGHNYALSAPQSTMR